MTASRTENLARLRQNARPIAPKQKFVVDDFRPEDAEGIARLFFAEYGESFPVDNVYDPEEMIRLNACGDLHQVVGRTENGDIVGLYALFRNPPGRRIMEAGSWIVHPAYRTTTLALRLTLRLHQNIPEHLGLDALFGQSVCDHILTQKLAARFVSPACALEIEVLEPRAQVQEGWSTGRISLLDQIQLLNDAHQELILPDEYANVLPGLYEALDLQRSFVKDGEPAEHTACCVNHAEAVSFARITVEKIGKDFAETFANLDGQCSGRHVSQLVLPLWQPGLPAAVSTARRAGYFLGGILPVWFDRDALLLQRIAGDPIWDNIQLLTEHSQEFLRIVRADWESVRAAG
ncbi:hypothetical protein [Oceanidesulfovibrio marinus]|uniref:N-acetyltransferase domain-containing protein n=1 Tax=Oceanidesulfovibrio marinus TaxID=370038 RepID=A0A6P1ZAD9_9BACT|nr:hypothetical protein [Oceanidesulfovibrio marinus]QJT07996.1 hypothetical protein E8L03_03215 [Oceanidesulfovibrio marinus]TVM30606.1 hypothetical protein DQK91_20450 [Oceanidesulfovibrio marinus]